MLKFNYIRDTLNSIIREEVSSSGIGFRLPAPVSTCNANSELWRKLKGTHPWMKTPTELLPEAVSVIVFALPLSIEAIESNVRGDYPSREWLRDYLVANKLLWNSSMKLASLLEEQGYGSLPMKPTHDFDSESLISSWSHRHAGLICGLGTFGLNNLLITPMGCAVRLCSVITEAPLEESPRPEFEYCLARRGIKCDACLRRCPVKALDDWSVGKRRCYERLNMIAEASDIGFADACGKCSTGIPCATSIPLVRNS